jgi:prepilin-type N-terminal cleavage/methylation domain-containing protein
MNRLHSLRDRREERGFTLIELMIVVAIIAILAIVVVPLFTGEAKKVKSKTEVSAMMAELATKQERYKNEKNTYLVVGECPTPASSTAKPVDPCLTAGTLPGDPWIELGIVPPDQSLRCSYEVYRGDSATAPTVPADFTAVQLPATFIAASWYMIHARCDMDNDGVIAHYVSSSFDATMQIEREGE